MDAGDNCTAANVRSFQTQEPTYFTFKLCVGLESRMAAVAIKQGSTIRHIDLSRKQQQ